MLIDYVNQTEENIDCESVFYGTMTDNESDLPLFNDDVISQSPIDDTLTEEKEEIQQEEIQQEEISSSNDQEEEIQKLLQENLDKYFSKSADQEEEIQQEEISSSTGYDYTEDFRVLQNCAYIQTYCLCAIIAFGALVLSIKFIKSFF